MGAIFEIVEWVRRQGDIHSLGRLRLRVLSATIKEGLSLSEVTPQTECSSECLNLVRDAASKIVGKPCPK